MRLPISLPDYARSRRGDARTCPIATAGARTWGGQWRATHDSIERIENGHKTIWKPSASAHAVMTLWDAGLPVPLRSVELTGGKTQRTITCWPGKKTRPGLRPAKSRTPQKVAAGAAAGGVVLLVITGLVWVVVAIVAAVAAALAPLAVRHMHVNRQHVPGRREDHFLSTAGTQEQTGTHARSESPNLPVLRPAPPRELAPVPAPSPRVMRELPAQPAPEEVLVSENA